MDKGDKKLLQADVQGPVGWVKHTDNTRAAAVGAIRCVLLWLRCWIGEGISQAYMVVG